MDLSNDMLVLVYFTWSEEVNLGGRKIKTRVIFLPPWINKGEKICCKLELHFNGCFFWLFVKWFSIFSLDNTLENIFKKIFDYNFRPKTFKK